MGVLNFSTENLITGVNVIDGTIYFTDNLNEPKKVDIELFRSTSADSGVTIIGDRQFTHTDVTVIRPHPYSEIDVVMTAFTPTSTQPEPPFEEIFPRFSYRWRYTDGQYSPYAPFTEAAFMSQTRDADTDNENYTEGYNTTMFNNVGTITLNNISRGTIDVEAVDILYTESISSTIYVLETLDIPEAHRGIEYLLNSSYVNGVPTTANYDLLPLSYQVSARKIYRALPPDQLTRPYDNVPRLAKAQEITANRVIYGNYLHRFDQPSNVTIDSQFIDADSQPYLEPTNYLDFPFGTPNAADVTAAQTASAMDGLSVKSNRSYEIGVVYIDNFGRQGAMIQAGSITAPDGSVTPQVPLVSPFNQNRRKKIVSTITSQPPSWADSYRYFIKDVSMDYHSLIAYNVYNDGALSETDSPYVWLEFLSTERNKIQDDSILIPRRTNGNPISGVTTDLLAAGKVRHLVQDIENEAPNAVRNQIASGPDVEYIPQGLPSIDGFSFSGPPVFSSDQGVGALPAAAAPSGSIVYLRESGGDGLAQYNWFASINGFLAQNRLPQLVEYDDNIPTTGTPASQQSVSIPFDAGQQLYMQFNGTGNHIQVKSITFTPVNANPTRDVLSIEFYTSVPSGLTATSTFQFFTARITEEAQERLQGRFWVRVARNQFNTVLSRSLFADDGEIQTLHRVWCEVEPAVDDSQLDLFWESSETFCVCTDHGWPNKINWTNCIAELSDDGVYLESTRAFNRFNSVQLTKGVRVNTPDERFAEERRAYGLTWSAIYNSRTGINRLNQFSVADGITKELEPNYGSIQKLHTRDTNVITFCEDKIFRILADKDLLFNADGGGNVSASNQVLGQTTPFIGEYGISTNPESFSSYGHNMYCSDKNRGAILQITPGNGQIFEVSERGMDDFFRDRLPSTDRIIGMYDDYSNAYTVSIQGYDPNNAMIDVDDRLPNEGTDATLKYELTTEGWPSRVSFIPEWGLTLNNMFYTWSGGKMYMHNDPNALRNNFYGTQYNSEIEVIFNDQPSAVKEFLTLGYEGTPDWTVIGIDTESDDTALTSTWPFKRKEGKYFAPIVGEETIYGFEDMEMGDSIMSDDDTPVMLYPQGTRETSGIKGFYNIVRLQNASTEAAELFAINTENYISSN